MFNTEIIETIKDRLSEFKNLQLQIGNQDFVISDYDFINSYILYNAVIDDRSDNIVIFHPTGLIHLLHLLSIGALAEYIKDVTNKDNLLSNNLRHGELVKVDGCLGRFSGEKEYNGKRFYIVECGGNKKVSSTALYIPVDQISRIHKYAGSATKLRGYKRKDNKPSKSIKIAEILNFQEESNIARTSHIAVLTDKKDFVEIIKQLKINGNKFTHIFPTAKIIAADKFIRIEGRRTGEVPVIYLASNFNMLEQFIRSGHPINLVIIDGFAKLNYSLINTMRDYNLIENMLVLLNHADLDRKRDLQNMSFKSWVWVPKDFTSLSPIGGVNTGGGDRNPFLNHYRIQNSLAKQKISVEEVGFPDAATDHQIRKLVKYLRRIANYKENEDVLDKDRFLISAYGLLYYFQLLPFPIDFSLQATATNGRFGYNPTEVIKGLIGLKDILKSRFGHQELNQVLDEITEIIENINKQFHLSIPKVSKLLELLKQEKGNIAVVVKKPWHVPVLLDWLKLNKIEDVTVFDFKSFKRISAVSQFDLVIFSGWFGDKTSYTFYSGVSSKIIFLSYPFEKRYVDHYLLCAETDIFNFVDIKTRCELLNIDEDEGISVAVKNEESKSSSSHKDDIPGIIDKLSMKVAVMPGRELIEDQDDAVEARQVIFEEGYHAYFSPFYKAKKLDRSEAKIEQKTFEELEVGDELIFVMGSTDDIFDELIKVVEMTGKFDAELKLSRIWKTAINDYFDREFCGPDRFSKILESVGSPKHPVTIINWLSNDRLIGPEYIDQTINAIAEVTKFQPLVGNIQGVISSCEKLRSLHIKLGRYLAECIVASVSPSTEDKLEEFMKERIKDLSKLVYTVEIKLKNDEMVNVARLRSNKLLDLEE